MFGQVLGAGLQAAGGLFGASSARKTARAQRALLEAQKKSLEMRDRFFTDTAGMARGIANRSADDMVAGLSPDQLAAHQLVRGNIGMGQQDYANLADRVSNTRVDVSDADIQRFMNPYMRDVVDASMADIDQMRLRRRGELNDQAEAAKAFGGDRAAIQRAVSDGEFDRTAANTVANLRHAGYESARGAAERIATENAGLRMVGNEQLQSLINTRRNAAYQDAAALGGVGAATRDVDQQRRNWERDRLGILTGVMSADHGAPDYAGLSDAMGRSPDPFAAALQGLSGGMEAGRGLLDVFGGMFGRAPNPGRGTPTMPLPEPTMQNDFPWLNKMPQPQIKFGYGG